MTRGNKKLTVYPSSGALARLGATTEGDVASTLNLAIEVYATLIAYATRDIARVLRPDDWRYLADVLNSTMYMPDVDPRAQITGNVEDAHALEGRGNKWYSRDPNGRVAKLASKINEMDAIHAWAVIWAVRTFWLDPERYDLTNDEWWTIAARVGKPD